MTRKETGQTLSLPWLAAGCAAAGVAAATLYRGLVRPWHLHWGATDEEVDRSLPGDDLLEDPTYESTRAITIDAPASTVWPWLVQIGQGRGGFYSYSWLENLVGADIHNLDRIRPELQKLQVGDTIRFGPADEFGEEAAATVVVLEPERALVLGPLASPTEEPPQLTGMGTWAFVLEPLDEQSCRLLVRTRGQTWPSKVLFMIFDPVHFLMERKMLYGVKKRAERTWLAERPRAEVGG